MRKFIYFVYLALFLSVTANAMDIPKKVCPMCNGNGVVCIGWDYYGNPRYNLCSTCGGYGWIPDLTSNTFQNKEYVYEATVTLYGYASNTGKYYRHGDFELYKKSGSYYIKSAGGFNTVYNVSTSSFHSKNFSYWCGGGGVYYYFNY